MATCRSCQAPILWAETEAAPGKPGKLIPLDAEVGGRKALVVPNGNLLFTGARTPTGTPIVRVQLPGMHRTHFASCPNANRHRRTPSA